MMMIIEVVERDRQQCLMSTGLNDINTFALNTTFRDTTSPIPGK